MQEGSARNLRPGRERIEGYWKEREGEIGKESILSSSKQRKGRVLFTSGFSDGLSCLRPVKLATSSLFFRRVFCR